VADLVVVIEGLTISDKIIASGREGLRDGERIRIIGEDAPVSGLTSLEHKRPARR
jgi:hypothetical protein